MSAAINIVIADDHPIFRDGFKVLLKDQDEVTLAGEAGDGNELMALVTRVQPDVVITDIKMPGMDGIQVCRHIKKEFPHVQVIGLSMFNDDHLIVDMLEAGAAGYLLKNTNRQQLLEAVRVVYEGGNFYSPATSTKLARLIGKSRFDPFKHRSAVRFTKRELEIIRMICDQCTTKEIASTLHLSIRTIESYRVSLHEKTESRNSIGVVIYAIKQGLYVLPE